MIRPEDKLATLVGLHQAIEDAADWVLAILDGSKAPDLSYPPGAELSAAERDALAALSIPGQGAGRDALRKVLLDALSSPPFEFFTLVDAVGDPPLRRDSSSWRGLSISSRDKGAPAEETMWHDDFYGSYQDYAERHGT